MKYLFRFWKCLCLVALPGLLLQITVDASYFKTVLDCRRNNKADPILWAGIQGVLDKYHEGDALESISQNYNAKNGHFVSSEQIRQTLPTMKQGRYCAKVGGMFTLLDWNFYAIDSMCGYDGALEIGMYNGQVKKVRAVYYLGGK